MLEKLKAKKAELEAKVQEKNAEIEKAKAEIVKVQEKIAVVDELIAEESSVTTTPVRMFMDNGIGISHPTNGNGFVL